MGIPPDGGEDILAFGDTEPSARKPRTRLLLGAVGGAGLTGAAVAVGLLAFGGGAAPAAHHQNTVTRDFITQSAQTVGGAQAAYSSELVITENTQLTTTVPNGIGRVVKIDPGTGRPTCPNP